MVPAGLSGGHVDILIVEDEKGICETLRIFLGLYGIAPRCATTLEQGLRETAAHRPDLILLDILLDGELGWPIIDRARELYRVPPRIVVISALVGVKEMTLNKNVELLEKPFDINYLQEILSEQYNKNPPYALDATR